MLERLAFALLNHSEFELNVFGYLIGLIGFAIGAAVNFRKTRRIQRAPYFLCIAAIFLLNAALGFVWLHTLEAMEQRILWVLLSGTYLATLAFGYFFGALAVARARDGFGRPAFCFLAAIPVVSIILVFKGSKDSVPGQGFDRLTAFSGGTIVVFGLIFAVIGVGLKFSLKGKMAEAIRLTETNTEFQQRAARAYLGSQSVEAVLKMMADEMNATEVPMVVDENTTLTRLHADGKTLRWKYTIKPELEYVDEEFNADLVRSYCENSLFRPYVDKGATLEFAYHRQDGSVFETITVTRKSCEREDQQ